MFFNYFTRVCMILSPLLIATAVRFTYSLGMDTEALQVMAAHALASSPADVAKMPHGQAWRFRLTKGISPHRGISPYDGKFPHLLDSQHRAEKRENAENGRFF
jgi:hypothetical protein